MSSSFEDSLKEHPPLTPINLKLAIEQHDHYIATLKTLIPNVITLEGDPNHPDCNFIEDTAIVVDDIAVISHMGAEARRGEEIPVSEVLKTLVKHIYHLEPSATMDGGDILYTGRHLIVGLSKRTNELALNQLKEIFKDKVEVIGAPVTEGLHLKSILSLFDEDTLIVADTKAGNALLENLPDYTFVKVPDAVSANVLRIRSTLLIQEGFPQSEKIISDLCIEKNVGLIKLNMSELIKADGALTCGSILFNRSQNQTD